MDPEFEVDIKETLERSNLYGVVGKYRVICPLVILGIKADNAKLHGKTEVYLAYQEAISLIKGMVK